MLIDPSLKPKNQKHLSEALSVFNNSNAEYFISFGCDRHGKVLVSATTKFKPHELATIMRNFSNQLYPVPTESDMVREFMLLFDQEFRNKPTLPTRTEMDFRVNFIKEELEELETAWNKTFFNTDNNLSDLAEFADGICDLFYVLHGLVLQAGMQKILPAMMAEVHRSNISKICKSQEEAEKTCEHVLETMGESCYIRTKEVQIFEGQKPQTVWMVYRERDKKVMKSINWSAPDLKTIIENATTGN
jgi:predicted HAD superfamily Cof-like phosphohydrolase